MYNSDEFRNPITVGKDKIPKLNFQISNTLEEYAFGTQLLIETEVELKGENIDKKDCIEKTKVKVARKNYAIKSVLSISTYTF